MNQNFRIKDLLITILPKEAQEGCDPSCDMGTHPDCTMGTNKDDRDWAIDPAELAEMKGALQQIIARIDVALYNRQILPESGKEKEMLQSKLESALILLEKQR